jgi:hypothetical protein
MRYRLLAVLPLVWGVVFLAGDALLPGEARSVFWRTQLELAKTLALTGGWLAALAFRPGEYPRRAWFLIGACMGLLLLRDLTLLPLGLQEALGAKGVELARSLLVVAANASQVVGTWLLARSWRVAGLSVPASPAAQWSVVGLVTLVVGAVAGPGLLFGLRQLGGGDLGALANLASALGDVLSLLLIAPLVLGALALRGGSMGWPFSLLSASFVAWLLYDALLALGPAAGLPGPQVRTISELFRALGCLFGFSAGLAQYLVVRQIRRLASALQGS